MNQFNALISNEGYGGLNPIQFGYENCRPSHSFGPAIRGYWLLHYVVYGYGVYEIGDRKYNVSPGEIFVIPPYEKTYYCADSKKPWSYIWIGFTADNDLPFNLPDIVRCPEALYIFNTMKKCTETENGRSAFLCARLWDLFSLLMSRKKSTPDYVEMALSCIHSEYMNNINIEQLASRLNLDRSYFYTIFKRKTGISPKQYLFNYRMNMAASLLLDMKVSVSVAAYSVGYSDIYNFSKMFKRHFGISPKNYAKMHQPLPPDA